MSNIHRVGVPGAGVRENGTEDHLKTQWPRLRPIYRFRNLNEHSRVKKKSTPRHIIRMQKTSNRDSLQQQN